MEGGALPQGPGHASGGRGSLGLLAALTEAVEALRLAELLVLLQELVLVINKQLKIKSHELQE